MNVLENNVLKEVYYLQVRKNMIFNNSYQHYEM